ncbi:hypothetical protein niasHS_010599 [Heterodera schachtii]|uniref:Uncharacterized protein n=1 Tax=Heterodera schachtii TaxID=97005 RepID=A0ABD2IUJ5_HETSC
MDSHILHIEPESSQANTQNFFEENNQLNFEIDTTESLTPVAGHICVEYRGCLLCWGGYCYDERDIYYRDCNWLYIFPFALLGARSNVWFKVQCESDFILRPNSGATAAIHRNNLFIFGGCIFDDNHRRMINTSMLLAIDLHNGRLVRKSFPLNSRIPTPRDKTTSWVADDKFFIFGGYGMSWHRLDHAHHQYFFRPHDFLDDDMGSCWNNQLLFYDLLLELWREAPHGGTKPSARAAAASAYSATLNKVFLFGGRHDQTRLNDLFVFDLDQMLWTQIESSLPSEVSLSPGGFPPLRPEGRSWCTFTLVEAQKKILCFGGLDTAGRPLSDLWELDVAAFYEHSAVNSPKQQRLIDKNTFDESAIGRLSLHLLLSHFHVPSRDSPFVRTLLVRRLCPPTLRHLSLNALAFQIVLRWSQEMNARKMAGAPESAAGTLGRRMNSESDSDLLNFVSRTFFAHLPNSLHFHLSVLLTIRKHSKALNLMGAGGANTPRVPSPMPSHWNLPPIPLQFHLLHLVDGRNLAGGNEESGGENEISTSSRPPLIALSPKSQRRALADEITALICKFGRDHRFRVPFLRSLFNATDFV